MMDNCNIEYGGEIGSKGVPILNILPCDDEVEPSLLLPIRARTKQRFEVKCNIDLTKHQIDCDTRVTTLIHPSQGSAAIISTNPGSSCSQAPSCLESSPSFTSLHLSENNIKDITSLYSIGRLVGIGSQSFVYTCSINEDNPKIESSAKIDLCIKHIVTDVSLRAIRSVCNIKHPNVAEHYSAYCDWRGLWVVMEYIDGRDLASYVTEVNIQRSVLFCRNVFIQMMRAMACVHEHNLIHRDIKLENFVVREFEENDSEFPCVALVDFGLAELKVCNELPSRRSPVGTQMYMAPEVLLGAAVDEKSDIWSAGILLSILLVKRSPFDEKNVISILDWHLEESIVSDIHGAADSIEHRLSDFGKAEAATAAMVTNFTRSLQWEGISDEAEDLLNRMLSLDPKKRPSANEVLQSSWLQETKAKKV